MSDLVIYRKRLIPLENILLNKDVILYADKNRIVTKWNVIRPRTDMDHGYSLYLLDEGIKISKFCKSDGSLYKWYCDIVEYYFDEEKNAYTALDLLLDITVDAKNEIRLLDMDELASAHKEGLINDELLEASLTRADKLLKTIYSGNFEKYTKELESYL